MCARKIKAEQGFTLIELLVVIAIVALLISIIVPSLNIARQKASSMACMSNVRHLSLGWYMYQQDHNGDMVSARMNGQPRSGGRVPGWVNQPYDSAGNLLSRTQESPAVTDEDEIRGIRDGALFPYVEDPGAYNCPSDRVISVHDGTERFRPYTIASGLASDHSERELYNFNNMRSPSTKFTFLEVAEQRNYVQGMFVLGTPIWSGGNYSVWWNPVAINHGDASTMGYADGHAETRRWRERHTFERIEKLQEQGGGGYGIDRTSGINSTNDEDLRFLERGWPGLKR